MPVPVIDKKDLKDADILIYSGHKVISYIIRFFDGSRYSHASLIMDDRRTLEANPDGVRRKTLQESVDRANSHPVIVMRLLNRPPDVAPVLDQARKYEGNRYGFEQILLLLLILSLRPVRRNNFLLRLAQKVLELAGSIILKLTDGGQNALICSELVYRSYNEALPGNSNPFAIVIDGHPNPGPVAPFMPIRRSIAQDNLISFLYGPASQLSSIGSGELPYVSPKNVLRKTDEFKARAMRKEVVDARDEAELEALFKDVVDSYEREDYTITKEEVDKTKASMDFFISASVSSKTGSVSLLANGNVIEQFLADHADFITPGDFTRSSSVIELGELDLSNLSIP